MAVNDPEDMFAGLLCPVPECEYLSDLAEGESDRLGSAHEPQEADGRFLIVAVPVRETSRLGNEPDLLVVADRLRAKSGPLAELTDAHAPRLPWVDLPVDWNLYAPVA